jgi:regulator of protease activity HflC (stomatin/prohibitin superfamily)
MEGFILIIAADIAATIFKTGVRVDREYERGVMFRLGRFQKIQGPGLYFTISMIDQNKVSLLRIYIVRCSANHTVLIYRNVVRWYRSPQHDPIRI